MDTKILNGKTYTSMLLGAGALLAAHVNELNDLNVFPVPDGDTGTNMARTLEGGLAEISSQKTDDIGQVSDAFVHGVMLSARGNSGVILSQIFAGIGEVLSGCENIDVPTLAKAFSAGVKRSYGAVRNPTEGTILTVFREATEYAVARVDDKTTVEDFLSQHIEAARRSLANTKELLPVLKEADVVDSGGAGCLCVTAGMYQGLTGKINVDYSPLREEHTKVDLSRFTRDSVLTYGYCTEFLLRLTTAKVDPDRFDVSAVITMLEELGGESIVAYKEGDIVKVHVHTFAPGEILSRAQAYGEFLTLKIENMELTHSETEVKPKKKNNRAFSVLAVVSGEGMCALFSDAGADEIVAGGQSANPSTEEFLEAFSRCDSEHLIVLPNNKNVFMAAKQAAELYTDATVHIIPTENPMQGYGALSVITPGITDIDVLAANAERAAKGVIGCEVARAVRDAVIGGRSVCKDEYMAIVAGEIRAVAPTANEAVCAMLADMDLDAYEIITLFAGRAVSEADRAALTEKLTEEYDAYEIVAYDGGQDVYDYLIAIE